MRSRLSNLASRQSISPRKSLIIGGVDIREVAACSCLGLRHAARLTTQLFDRHLKPAELTVGQFGVLAQLHAVSVWRSGATLKELSGLIGMDPTTLNRTLLPLLKAELVSSRQHPEDGRARIICLTSKGSKRLAFAMKYWKAAQAELNEIVGPKTVFALSGPLKLTTKKMRS